MSELQTPAEQVLLALSGWPQCWKCEQYQPPHAARLRAMQKHLMTMCCCTRCRLEKVKCKRCGDEHATFDMRWLLTDLYLGDGAGNPAWKPFCIGCCRSQQRQAAQRADKDVWKRTDFRRYPDGPTVSVPQARRRSYARPRYNRTRRP